MASLHKEEFNVLDLEKESHAVCVAAYAYNQESDCPLGRLIEVIKLEGVTDIDDIKLQPQLLQLEAMNDDDLEAMWEPELSVDWQIVAEKFIHFNRFMDEDERKAHSQRYEAELQTQLDACIASIDPPAPPSEPPEPPSGPSCTIS